MLHASYPLPTEFFVKQILEKVFRFFVETYILLTWVIWKEKFEA